MAWLLVGDSPNQVVGRLAAGLRDAVAEPPLELTYSHGTSTANLLRRTQYAEGVFWADQIRFRSLGRCVCRPQVVWVHHLTDDLLGGATDLLVPADAIVTASSQWQRTLERATGREVAALPYTLDDDWFEVMHRRVARDSLDLPHDLFLVGFSGKATADRAGRKGVDLFAAALDLVGPHPSFQVLLVGPGWDSLETRLRSQGHVVHRREFTRSEDTRAAYASMDVLLITSRTEGGPCTLLEAMAQGVPAISTAVGHVPELVRHGENGWIATDADSFAHHLRRLLDDGVSRSIAEAARVTALDRRTRAELLAPSVARALQRARDCYSRRPIAEVAVRHLRRIAAATASRLRGPA